MKTPARRALAVGDRVKVYREMCAEVGTVLEAGMVHPDFVSVQLEDEKIIRPHRKQCRRLVPKDKAKGEVPVRLEKWAVFYPGGSPTNEVFNFPYRDENHAKQNCGLGGRVVRLLETFPGEMPASKKQIADAWDSLPSYFGCRATHAAAGFSELCRVLGLADAGVETKKEKA